MASNDKLIRIILKLQDEMTQPLNNASGGLDKLAGQLTSVGQAMTVGLTLPLVAIGAAGVKMAVDLDKSMRSIQSVGKQTDAELAVLSDTFIEMSTDMTKTVDSANNLAEGFYNIQGSGFEGADAMKVLEASTKAASAGMTTTEIAAKGVAAVLNSYGKGADEAAHISDLLFKTVDRGVGSFEELVGSVGDVVGVAKTVGVGFDEVSAAIATMSKQGLSFSEASVSLNQALLAFLKPSTEMEAIIKKLGYSSGQAMIDALGFAGAMEALAEETGGSAEQMAGLFGNVRALRAATALTGEGAKMFAEDLNAMAEAAGSTDEAFEIISKSFEFQFKNFMNNVNALLIEVGQVLLPGINAFIQGALMPLIDAFRAIPEPIRTVIVAFGVFLAAMGPVLTFFGTLIATFVKLKGAIIGLPVLFAKLSGGFAAIAAGAGTALGTVVGLITSIATAAAGAAASLWAMVAPLIAAALPIIVLIALIGAVVLAIAFLITHFDKIVAGLKAWGGVFTMAIDIVGRFADKLKNAAAQAVENFLANLKKGVEGVKNFGNLLLQAIGKAVLDVFAKFVTITKSFRELGINIIKALIDGIKNKISELISTVSNLASAIVSKIKSAFQIRSPSKVMAKMGAQVAEGFNQGVQSMGGIGVSVPQLSGSGSGMSLSASGGGGIYVQNLNVPPGTTREQVDHILRELGKRTKQKGARGI